MHSPVIFLPSRPGGATEDAKRSARPRRLTREPVMPDKPRIPIIIDTREQRSWQFPGEQFDVTTAALWAGDYSLKTDHPVIAIERKSLGDFVQTVIHDWIRFRKELWRLACYETAVIAVECNLEQIAKHQYESEALPASVLCRAESCLVDHGVPVVFWGEPVYAQVMAARLLGIAWKRYKGQDE